MQPILSSAQMCWADAYTIKEQDVPGITLMENAGKAVAGHVRANLCRNSLVLVLAGSGNNGGDGFAAAHALMSLKINVQVVLLGSLESLRGDAARSAEQAASAYVSIIECVDEKTLDAEQHTFDHAGMIIDALFGTGLARPLDGLMAHAVDKINAAPASVLSVDIASGINSDDGSVLGTAVHARWTLPIAAYKWGHRLGEGREYAGDILPPAAIGIEVDIIARAQSEKPGLCNSARLIQQADIRVAFPARPYICHKRDFGHVWIFGASQGYTGAPQLAASGAFAVGAGLVSIACPESVYPVVAASSLEAMVHPQDEAPWQVADVVLAGPGWGSAQQQQLTEVIAADKTLVLDADALNMLAADKALAKGVGKRKALTVLTPHPGEAGRLLGVKSKAVQDDRLSAVLFLAKIFHAWIVLKGADSLIASPRGDVWVCPFGSSNLAVAGTGDVLAGMLAGTLGRSQPPEIALPAAVGLHALTGERDDWFLAGELGRLVHEALSNLR